MDVMSKYLRYNLDGTWIDLGWNVDLMSTLFRCKFDTALRDFLRRYCFLIWLNGIIMLHVLYIVPKRSYARKNDPSKISI